MSLVDRARAFVEREAEPQSELLRACLLDGSVDGLHAVQILFEDMYGGMTFNFELKAPAGYCLLRWGTVGLSALVEGAKRTPTTKNHSIVLDVLSSLAAGQRRSSHSRFCDPRILELVDELCPHWEQMTAAARGLLSELVLSFETDDDALAAIGAQFLKSGWDGSAAPARELFEASAGRLLAVGEPTLREFSQLLDESPGDEAVFQQFFTDHPQILDPMAVEIWPEPSLWGAREPDFVLRRADNTYLIAELETPAKILLTATGQISAPTSHAVHQVIDYADRLAQRQDLVDRFFPGFRAPDCLVVTGLERTLSADQARMLVLENSHHHGVRIVGFDWLITRARAIAANFVGHRVRVSKARLT